MAKATRAKYPADADGGGMNKRRARWAEAAIKEFMIETGVDREDALCDILADLAHWADRNKMAYANELRRAKNHYEAETMSAKGIVTGKQFEGVEVCDA